MTEATLTVINLNERWADCAMCGAETPARWSVGWYCGPVRQMPGEQAPGWKGEAIAGGMPVCHECHDRFYGEMADG